MKTRWFKEWLNGTLGNGPVVTYYQNQDKNIVFNGYSRLEFPLAGKIWEDLKIGETLKTINGSLWERVK